MNKIFDCHLHVEKGLIDYDLDLDNANVIFNSVQSYIELSESYSRFYQSLIFDYRENFDFVSEQINSNKIIAIKIHSRIQKIKKSDYTELSLYLSKIANNVPVIYDAFYYGSDLETQPSLEGLIYLANNHSKRKFIVAHSGGYKVLEYFFHLRNMRNVGFDLSFSLQYLKDSSAELDLIKLLKFTPSQKIFFGSDFPAASPLVQKNILLEMLQKLNYSSSQIEGVFKTNWLNFISETDDPIQ